MWFLFIVMLIAAAFLALIVARGQQAMLEGMPETGDAEHGDEAWFPEGALPRAADLAGAYARAGFEDVGGLVTEAAQPCFRICLAVEDEGQRSRAGGVPDLPDSAAWPTWDGVPLAFLAQIDLGELAAINPNTLLPKQGLIQFYYDAGQRTWGTDPKDRDSWRVLYFRDPFEPASIEHWPEGLPDHACFPIAPLLVEESDSFPDELIERLREGKGLRAQGVIEEIFAQYEDCHDGPCHQVLGFPYSIKGDPRLTSQLASNGVYCGDEIDLETPEALALAPGAAEWQLLFQFDTDEQTGMSWGDCGTLHFLIRRDDLAAERFDRAWMVLQCI